jgi:hypothetical protein
MDDTEAEAEITLEIKVEAAGYRKAWPDEAWEEQERIYLCDAEKVDYGTRWREHCLGEEPMAVCFG